MPSTPNRPLTRGEEANPEGAMEFCASKALLPPERLQQLIERRRLERALHMPEPDVVVGTNTSSGERA